MISILRRLAATVLAVIFVVTMFNSCSVNSHKHTVVVTDRIAPGCFEFGYTAGEYCSTCSDYSVGREKIAPIGQHTPVNVDEIPATCGTSGVAAGVECSVCKEKLEGRDRIPPTNRHKCKDPTWIWDSDYLGVAAVFECVVCKTTSTSRTSNISKVELSDGTVEYSVTVAFAGTTYSDTKTIYPEN